jgi:hypothetical protein
MVDQPIACSEVVEDGRARHLARYCHARPYRGVMLTTPCAGWSFLTSVVSLRLVLVFLLRHRHRSSARNKSSDPENNSQHAAHHKELEQRTASSRIIQIVQRPLHSPSSLVPRAVQLLVPHLMSILVEVRHIVVHALCETARPGARSRWVVVRPLWSTRSVLRALLALLAPTS